MSDGECSTPSTDAHTRRVRILAHELGELAVAAGLLPGEDGVQVTSAAAVYEPGRMMDMDIPDTDDAHGIPLLAVAMNLPLMPTHVVEHVRGHPQRDRIFRIASVLRLATALDFTRSGTTRVVEMVVDPDSDFHVLSISGEEQWVKVDRQMALTKSDLWTAGFGKALTIEIVV